MSTLPPAPPEPVCIDYDADKAYLDARDEFEANGYEGEMPECPNVWRCSACPDIPLASYPRVLRHIEMNPHDGT
jgi:hypothetical protein